MTRSRLHVSLIKTWTIVEIVKADHKGRITFWVKPGWYRRSDSPDGIINLNPIHGWQLLKHRLLWGFSDLTDARQPKAVAQ